MIGAKGGRYAVAQGVDLEFLGTMTESSNGLCNGIYLSLIATRAERLSFQLGSRPELNHLALASTSDGNSTHPRYEELQTTTQDWKLKCGARFVRA